MTDDQIKAFISEKGGEITASAPSASGRLIHWKTPDGRLISWVSKPKMGVGLEGEA